MSRSSCICSGVVARALISSARLMPALISGPFSWTSAAFACLTSACSSSSPTPNACSRMSSIANWWDESVEPRASSFRSSRASGVSPDAAADLRFLARRVRKLRPGMSGIIDIQVSIALTSADLGPCISPSRRSATRFAVFSSNWNESSSIESISSAIGSSWRTTAVPMSSPRATAWGSVCLISEETSMRSAPEA